MPATDGGLFLNKSQLRQKLPSNVPSITEVEAQLKECFAQRAKPTDPALLLRKLQFGWRPNGRNRLWCVRCRFCLGWFYNKSVKYMDVFDNKTNFLIFISLFPPESKNWWLLLKKNVKCIFINQNVRRSGVRVWYILFFNSLHCFSMFKMIFLVIYN